MISAPRSWGCISDSCLSGFPWGSAGRCVVATALGRCDNKSEAPRIDHPPFVKTRKIIIAEGVRV